MEKMSTLTSVPPPMPFPGGNHGHFDGMRFMNEAQTSHASQPATYQDHPAGDERIPKEPTSEAAAQMESTPNMPQQYQFQGPMPLQLKYNFRPGQKPSFQSNNDPDFDGRKLRRTTMRKTVDYNSSIIRELENRLWQRDYRDREHLQPDVLYIPHILPPPSYRENPFNAVTTRFVKTATNKVRCPVFCLAWTPEGRRLITGTSSGEFTLWNGLTFNFETILQAHDCPVRTMVWSNNEQWMLTGDHSGFIKYWQSNMNNVKMYQGHREAVRGISFSPTDNKFVSCSDDGTVRLWDFITCNEERIFRGHGADVKCCSWHPYKSLVASGSKDNQQPVKLWDPRSGKSMATIHAHKATVMDIKWNQNGNWVATASRDHLIKLYDIRNLSTDMQVFRGHKKETSVIAWHPQHEGLMCSGGSDGSILFWHVGTPKEVAAIDQAHDSIVWALAWHPLGHILCSGSNDHSCKFWTRNHPGDPMRDKYNLNTIPQSILGFEEYEDESGTVRIPGMGPEDKVDASKLPDNIMSSIPGLDSSIFRDKSKPQKKVPYAKPIPKNFQAQWNSELKFKDTIDENFVPDAKMMASKLFEHAPGAVNVKDLKVEALYVYGKTVPVKENSELAKVIGEGRERILDYVNEGNVPELVNVIPHFDPNESIRRYRAQHLVKSRGRQFSDAVTSLLNHSKKPERNMLKRSKDTNAPIPSKKWRGSERESAPYSSTSSSKYPPYSEQSDYRDRPSSKGRNNDNYSSYNNHNEDYDYENYDYENSESNYPDKRASNYSKDNWEDDDYQYGNSADKRYGWNKGGHQDADYSEGGGKGFKSDRRPPGQSEDYYDSRSNSRFAGSSRKERAPRGRRGSGSSYPRRPFRGSASGSTSRQQDPAANWEDEEEEYYNEERDYDRNEGGSENYYDDYREEAGGSNYGGSSRGSRHTSGSGRGRGESRGRGGGSFGRGRGSSGAPWRGGRGKEAPRRSRGRGGPRGGGS